MEHVSYGDTKYNWWSWIDPKRFTKRAGEFVNRWTSRDNPNYVIAEVNQNTEKSPGDFRRLAVAHTSVKDYHLMLM